MTPSHDYCGESGKQTPAPADFLAHAAGVDPVQSKGEAVDPQEHRNDGDEEAERVGAGAVHAEGLGRGVIADGAIEHAAAGKLPLQHRLEWASSQADGAAIESKQITSPDTSPGTQVSTRG